MVRGTTGPRFVDQTFQAVFQKSLSPFADGWQCDVQFICDSGIGQAFGGREDDTKNAEQFVGRIWVDQTKPLTFRTSHR